ncbi:o-succinylbenzoate--CoA ligase [Planococcus lenghuensis]|uniref:2-succinylbenzoate--CoA ligase n=1 Tax=Planococcus lenghuensis TaxID=2213202 RepID=A0A1Q2KXA7_9BACL|nr:o-succinylbenzoate--CoA ligase [Planococcus lenghuensis]AQQ52744.1 o-succinylbenzoate--CoA ligase [Planococcus lenghuensis]
MYPNWLMKRAQLTGERVGLSWASEEWTFAELDVIARDLAGRLVRLGVQRDSRVALLSKSHPDFVFMMHACLHLGCEMVMLNERLTEQELIYQVQDCEADTVLTDDANAERLNTVNKLLFSTIKEAVPAEVEIQREWPVDRVVSIMYTSGTTGFPKGVKQTAENHFSSAIASSLNIGLGARDSWLCMVPLFHISGFSILMRSLIYGAEVRLYPKFDAANASDELIQGNVTHMSVVGVTLARILDELDNRQMAVSPNFRVMLAGGGPVAVSHIERAAAHGINVLQTYGMTETASQTTTLSPEDAADRPGSAGKPLFLYDVKIGAEDEILIKGPHVTAGYIGRFADVQPTEDGYLKTGDIGRIDAEGFLYVLDRRSDLIVSGGENIYPAEIENVLTGHPAVLEAGVCGIRDGKWGEVPAAFVVADTISAEELDAYCRERLASYKVPKRYSFVRELPRNASNKLLRRELKTWN